MGLKSLFKQKIDGSLMRKDIDMELFRHFKIIKVLGKGSYSTVYQAERLSDGRDYAIKVTDVATLSARERKDMVNEIRLLASLQHPNLMQYYEAFCDHHQLCIVTDLATRDLGSFIDKHAESGDLLPEREVWSFFIQMALGIQYLHHNHVLHRDIKPQNILISKSGLLKIADLGISQVLEHVFTRAMIGTPYYMSPEMWKREPYSYSADVWALGCILYELCSLKPLYMAREEKDIKKKVLSGVIDTLPPRYSYDLWEVMSLTLTSDPALRPTIDEILELPAVQLHLSLVPDEDQNLLFQAPEDHVELLQPIQVPRMSADWSNINVFLPPAKYSTGPGVVDSLRMKASRSCPDLLLQEELASGSAASNDDYDGGNAEFSRDGRMSFGQITAANTEYFDATRRTSEPPIADTFRKVPSVGNLRLLERSHSISVGEVEFNTHRTGEELKEGAGELGQGKEGSQRGAPQDGKKVAATVAAAWERARGRGDVGGRHSVTVANVMMNHTTTDDFVGVHDRHEHEMEEMISSADRFKPMPVVFCPAPLPRKVAKPMAAIGETSALRSVHPRTPTRAPVAPAAVPAQAQAVAAKGSPHAAAGKSVSFAPEVTVASAPKQAAPAKKKKGGLFGFLKKAK